MTMRPDALEAEYRRIDRLKPRRLENDARRLCLGCGHDIKLHDGYCSFCVAAKAEGLDWRGIYDRDAGEGRIPANLLDAYPELKKAPDEPDAA